MSLLFSSVLVSLCSVPSLCLPPWFPSSVPILFERQLPRISCSISSQPCVLPPGRSLIIPRGLIPFWFSVRDSAKWNNQINVLQDTEEYQSCYSFWYCYKKERCCIYTNHPLNHVELTIHPYIRGVQVSTRVPLAGNSQFPIRMQTRTVGAQPIQLFLLPCGLIDKLIDKWAPVENWRN